jgi:hypothetical protein
MSTTIRFTEDTDKISRPKTICKDGFVVSVQGSSFHYSSPKKNNATYTNVEVGFPSERPEPWLMWEEFCEDPERPTETVYGYVPAEMVLVLLESHGGVLAGPFAQEVQA